LLEVIVVDNDSEDNTVDLARSYGVKVLFNNVAKDAEVSKMIGLRESTGELFMYLDADIELAGVDWFSRILLPLEQQAEIAGAFPRFVPKKQHCAIGRYFRYNQLELDPLLEMCCTSIGETVIEDKRGYRICEFDPPRVPPIGICVYRRHLLMTVVGTRRRFMDVDVPVVLARRGYRKFAYVPSAGIYHNNVRSLLDLVRRRIARVNINRFRFTVSTMMTEAILRRNRGIVAVLILRN